MGIIPKIPIPSTPKEGYVLIIGAAAAYGAGRGFINWASWMSERDRLTIKPEIVEGIVNVGRDVGHAIARILGYAGAASAVAATAPISVPVIVYMQPDGTDVETQNVA